MKVTKGYLLAIEHEEGDPPPEPERMKDMFETFLYDHGYTVTINIGLMGDIDVYPEEETD